ncbi:speckle-type POZ protein B-like [Planococcus citri]|uniref:speckle-type POZ protein B-like n=1 Tax=Planococcus citri TaxID=170843 RepID=UPI0031F9355C
MSNNTRNAESKGSSSHSKTDRKTCAYVWTIRSYRKNDSIFDSYESPAFAAADDDFTFKWWLELFRNRKDEITISLSPNRDRDLEKCSPVSGNLKITLMNNDGTWYRSGEASFQLNLNETDPFFELYICDGNDLDVNGLESSKKLFVWCHVEYEYMKKPKLIESSLSHDLERIRTDENFSDVTISVNGKNYPAHKLILAARSSVFKAMFTNDMLESQKNNVTIDDIKQETFEEMLRYIYTGEMRNLDEWAFELFPAADKYDLKELKNACEELLLSKVSTDNVGKILLLADMHNAEELKANALRFIKKNYYNRGNYKNTEVWKILSESRRSLLIDMLAVFFEKTEL